MCSECVSLSRDDLVSTREKRALGASLIKHEISGNSTENSSTGVGLARDARGREKAGGIS